MTGQLKGVIEHPIHHTVKFEACLVWPDGSARTAFTLPTIVRLYRKEDLEGIVKRCRAEERPVAYREVEDSGKKPVAEAVPDPKTGYFYFAEEWDGEAEDTPDASVATFKKIDAWPTSPTRYYVAVQGCAVALPLVAAKVDKGKPVRESKNAFDGAYLLDAEAFGCLLEIEVREVEADGAPALVWKLEAAFAGPAKSAIFKGADEKPYYREVLEPAWSYKRDEIWPGEVMKRRPIPLIAVIPLLALDPRPPRGESGDLAKSPHKGQDRWSTHPSLEAKVHADVEKQFNPDPGSVPRLQMGLNVDSDGKPGKRLKMFPGAVLDISRCGAKAKLLDAVRVKFFENDLRIAGIKGDITLRHFAFDKKDDVAQIPVGDAVCLATHEGAAEVSRIKLFRGDGFAIAAPLMPHYTANVDTKSGEELYEPLSHVSGSALVGGTLVDCSFRDLRGGKGGSLSGAYEWPADNSVAPAEVRKLFYYQRDYFRVGGTGGIYTSSRSNPSKHHVGIDFHNYCLFDKNANDGTLKGEAGYAMYRGAATRSSGGDGTVYTLAGTFAGDVRKVQYMHAHASLAPGLAKISANDAQLVWRGQFLGFTGSSGNADGKGVASKHLHMYAYRAGARICVGTLFLAGTCTIVKEVDAAAVAIKKKGAEAAKAVKDAKGTDAAAEEAKNVAINAELDVQHKRLRELDPLYQRNHQPWISGTVKDPAKKALQAKEVQIIVYDLSTGKTPPDAPIAAITTPNKKGEFQLFVPPGLSLRIVATRAFCSKPEPKCKDAFVDRTFAANVKYAADKGGDVIDFNLEKPD